MRCKTCFAMICEENPSLVGKDPTHAAMRQIKSVPGNNFAAGLSLSKERTELLISGGNQSWYSFKSMMIEHASCSTNRNGGMAHYRALVAEKQRKKVKKSVLQVISNQLKCALFIVKSKTAALHYENVIGLLHSSGAAVGNIGHGRNQMIDMMKAFQAYLNRKTRDALLKALPASFSFSFFILSFNPKYNIHLNYNALGNIDTKLQIKKLTIQNGNIEYCI